MPPSSETLRHVWTGSKISLSRVGETALRLLLAAALPISATIFFIQTV